MLIEIGGIDGAGKSTLAAAISGALIRRGIRTYVRSQHSHVRRIAQSISDMAGTSRAEYVGHDAVEFAAALELVARSHEFHLASAGAAVFIVEPYVTCSAAIAATVGVSNFAAVMDAYAWAHPADLTLFVETSPATAFRRIQGRASSDNVTLRNGERDLVEYASGFEKVLARLESASLLRLDGDAPAHTISELCMDEILRLLGGQKSWPGPAAAKAT